MKRIALIAVFLLVATNSWAGFVNAGFETGDFTGWNVGCVCGELGVAPDGTPVFSGLFQPAFVNVRSGNFAAFGSVAFSNGDYYSLSQDVDVAAGLQRIGFFLGHDDSTPIGIDGAIQGGVLAIYIDGVNYAFTVRNPGNDFPNGSTPADMVEFATDFLSLGGPVNIEFRISGSGTGRTVLSLDDAFVSGVAAVPEPASLALLGIGLFGLGAVRRRIAA